MKTHYKVMLCLIFITNSCSQLPESPTAEDFMTMDQAISLMTQIGDEWTPTPTVRMTLESPVDFGLIFEYRYCSLVTVNTFNQTISRDQMMPETLITLPFQFTNSQMDEIYSKLIEIDYLQYPDIFNTSDYIKRGSRSIYFPHPTYRIIIRNNGIEKEIFWEDMINNPNPIEAQKLRELFRLIIDIYHSSEAYKQLPELRIVCY